MTSQDAWDRVAFDEMRTRLHARFDDLLAPGDFGVEAFNRPAVRGLTRKVLLHVSPDGGGIDGPWSWPVSTRTWTAKTVQHQTLEQIADDIATILGHYADGDGPPFDD